MKIGGLFSGIGGFCEAFRRAGFDVRWCCEIDEQCQTILRRHFPGIPIYGDIYKLQPEQLEDVDVITFGSPCQNLSCAGTRSGLYGEKSVAFFEAIRIIKAKRPRFCLWENVPGAFSSYSGDIPTPDELQTGEREGSEDADFWTAIDAIRQCGPANVAWSVFDSQWHGVPQRRRRIFTIGDFRADRGPEILSIAESLQGHPEPRRETGKEVTGTLSARTEGGGGLGTDFEWQGGSVAQEDRSLHIETHPPNTAYALGCGQGGSKIGSGCHNQDTFVFKASHFTRGKDGAPSDVVPPLSADADKGDQDTLIAFSCKDNGRDVGDLSPTLRAMESDKSHANGGGQVAVAFYAKGGATRGISLGESSPTLKDSGHQIAVAIPFDTTQITSPGNYSHPKSGDPCHPLSRGQHPPAMAYQCQGSNVGEMGTLKGNDVQRGVPFTFETRVARNGRGAPSELVNALKSEPGKTGKGDASPCVVQEGGSGANTMIVIRLTPL